ncbi:zinc-binding dehydrogenase [Pelomonas sp. KK5]|uniref:zinc-dependent alcohol dehydrogenase n=1 Tax=Pelomonas sp. KK5 TaxID=1855730 RepID=UPI00097BD2B8|nr:alcohol dehydrogenase catalytic domain-containing protein [Pelomonas sp. KK5]
MSGLPSTMRAAVLVAPGRFELRSVPVPRPGPDEVLIRVRRCGLCGTDIHIFKGHYSADRLPLIPGHEFAGEVAALGEGVRSLKLGQTVTADINIGCGACFYCRKNEVLNCPDMAQVGIHVDGGLAEYVRVPASHVVPVPANTPVELAALAEPVSCIVRAVKKSGLRLGESVLILGSGPIGNLHLQLARRAGAAPIIVSEPNPGRAAWARESGADIVVTDPALLRQAVLDATGGRGADLVIESVGLTALYEQAFELVRPGGRVLAFGLAEPSARAHYLPFQVVLKELGLIGSVAGMGDDMHEAMTLIAHDRVRLGNFIETVYPLARIAEAMEAFINDRSINKVQIAL